MIARYILDTRTATARFPGIGRYVRNLVPALVSQSSPDEQWVLLWNPRDPTAWDPAELAGPQVAVIPVPVSPFALGQQWAVPRQLRRLAWGGRVEDLNRPAARVPSLYHSTYYLMPYWPGLPTVLTVYDLIAMRLPHTVSLRARLLARIATALALRAAAHVIAISQATRADLLSHFPRSPDQVTVVPLAPDPRFRPQPPPEIARVRARYGLPEAYFLYLGINKPHKNLVHLLRAYRGLATTQAPGGGPPPALVIAGPWDSRYPQPRQEARALGLGHAVRFLGPVAEEDLAGLYSGCTAFVFPSLYEGFGLPVLEAMACGAAVICGNRSSLPEVAGDAALLVDPMSVEAWTQALARVWRDPGLAADLRERGRRRAARFTWERTARETLAVYRRALEGL